MGDSAENERDRDAPFVPAFYSPLERVLAVGVRMKLKVGRISLLMIGFCHMISVSHRESRTPRYRDYPINMYLA
jgi:hypothetical protein